MSKEQSWVELDDDVNTADREAEDEDIMMTIPRWLDKVDILSAEQAKVALTYAADLLTILQKKLPVGDPGNRILRDMSKSLRLGDSSRGKRRSTYNKSYYGRTIKKARIQTPKRDTNQSISIHPLQSQTPSLVDSSHPGPDRSGTTSSGQPETSAEDRNNSSQPENNTEIMDGPTEQLDRTFETSFDNEWRDQEDEHLPLIESHTGKELVSSEEIDNIFEPGDERKAVCLRIQQDLAIWLKATDTSQDSLSSSFANLLNDNDDSTIRTTISEMTSRDIRETIRKMESNTSRALFEERLTLIQLAAWVEREMEWLEVGGLQSKEALGEATNRLLQGLIIAPSNVIRTRKQWLRRIRTGTRWKQLYGHFDAGILIVPHSLMGVSTLGDMAEEKFRQTLSALLGDDDFKTMVRQITKWVKGTLAPANNEERDNTMRQLEQVARGEEMDFDDEDVEMV